jgi:hypothetical protein
MKSGLAGCKDLIIPQISLAFDLSIAILVIRERKIEQPIIHTTSSSAELASVVDRKKDVIN